VSDLAARLHAVVEERLAVARAAGEPFGSRWSIRMTAGALGPDVGEHIALNGPADVILACERDLAVLERHAAKPGDWSSVRGHEHEVRCEACHEIDHDVSQPWPCPEILGLATRYRVEVDG